MDQWTDYADPDPTPRWMRSVVVEVVVGVLVTLGTWAVIWEAALLFVPNMIRD
jgi:hypothetical protein